VNTSQSCRSCGSPQLRQFLDLGIQPLANNLPRPEDSLDDEPKFPLRVSVCEDCHLVQITDTVPPVTLFGEYLYFSSFSDTMVKHAAEAAKSQIAACKLGGNSFVVEIASNDGYLLKNFVAAGIPCLGVEPAANIAKVAAEAGIPTLCEFFGLETATEIVGRHGQADLILGNNVFAHAPEINDFIGGMARLLKPGGRIVLEFPYLGPFIENIEFDTVYHEHVFYFSILSLTPAFNRHGLDIFDASFIEIHGGSLRLSVGHVGVHNQTSALEGFRKAELEAGMATNGYYDVFGKRVDELRAELLELVTNLKKEGKSIAAYGASAKGSTLLNYFGIGSDVIDFVVDRSTYKQGRVTPGTHLPILPPDQLLELQPDYTLLLTWNFASEILAQQKTYRDDGGKFIIPLPKPVIV